MKAQPDRWLHLRHPAGFDDTRFEQFRGHCDLLRAHVQALIANWGILFPDAGGAPSYEFAEPTRSPDGHTVSLPIGGSSTVFSRHLIEGLSSWMLWRHFPRSFREALEEGLTETIDSARGPETSWRRPAEFISFGKLPPK